MGEQYGSTIIEQFKRLGATCDYSASASPWTRTTRARSKVFVALYEKGYIYRDNYMVNWCPGSRSAISDLEVEHREVDGHDLLHRLPVRGLRRGSSPSPHAPGDDAGRHRRGGEPDDERYRDLVGSHCILPLVGRALPIIADEHVDPEFGTGALKITPGHDPNDFEIGREHGLEEITSSARTAA